MATNCPWCGAGKHTADTVSPFVFACGSIAEGNRQTQRCRIRQLEAEAAGVAGLRTLALTYGRDENLLNAALRTDELLAAATYARNESFNNLAKHCRELAEKGESDDES